MFMRVPICARVRASERAHVRVSDCGMRMSIRARTCARKVCACACASVHKCMCARVCACLSVCGWVWVSLRAPKCVCSCVGGCVIEHLPSAPFCCPSNRVCLCKQKCPISGHDFLVATHAIESPPRLWDGDYHGRNYASIRTECYVGLIC